MLMPMLKITLTDPIYVTDMFKVNLHQLPSSVVTALIRELVILRSVSVA